MGQFKIVSKAMSEVIFTGYRCASIQALNIQYNNKSINNVFYFIVQQKGEGVFTHIEQKRKTKSNTIMH